MMYNSENRTVIAGEVYENDQIQRPGSRSIQSFMTLEDNDIIMSGTPKGVNTYNLGDKFVGQVYAGDALLLEKMWIVESLKN